MSINSKMTAIAEPIRTLKGTSSAMGLDAMASNLSDVVNECDTQADLIAQIKTALADKAAGGVVLPTLTNPGSASDLAQGKQLIGADGSVVEGAIEEGSALYTSGYDGVTTEYDDYAVGANHTFAKDRLFRKGDTVALWFGGLGNADVNDVPQGVTFTSDNGLNVEGNVPVASGFGGYTDASAVDYDYALTLRHTFPNDTFVKAGYTVAPTIAGQELGDATPEDVRAGKTFTAWGGLKRTGTALLPGGGSVYPDGAFAPVTSFTDGKQYALVSMIGGVRRYINTTDYNQYTMNATEISIAEDAGDYVIFSATPALFTAVASGDGFLLRNGSNYLHGTSSDGTALRVGTTQMVWTVDDSATGGFSDGKYYEKEDANAVWLMNASGGYNWSIKYETDGRFGYDREGRDNQWSTGFAPFVLYEYVAGEGEVNPVVDTSDATATIGGSTGATVASKTTSPTANSTSISFTGLTAQPKMFSIAPKEDISFSTSNRFVVNVMYDGTTTHGMYVVGSGSVNASYTGTYSATYFTWTYSNGTLTVTTSSATNGGYFASGVDYQLTYAV